VQPFSYSGTMRSYKKVSICWILRYLPFSWQRPTGMVTATKVVSSTPPQLSGCKCPQEICV